MAKGKIQVKEMAFVGPRYDVKSVKEIGMIENQLLDEEGHLILPIKFLPLKIIEGEGFCIPDEAKRLFSQGIRVNVTNGFKAAAISMWSCELETFIMEGTLFSRKVVNAFKRAIKPYEKDLDKKINKVHRNLGWDWKKEEAEKKKLDQAFSRAISYEMVKILNPDAITDKQRARYEPA
jgi:hypothetical protein